jgi:hypothetical protein
MKRMSYRKLLNLLGDLIEGARTRRAIRKDLHRALRQVNIPARTQPRAPAPADPRAVRRKQRQAQLRADARWDMAQWQEAM